MRYYILNYKENFFMFKKIVTIGLLLVMALSVAGCSLNSCGGGTYEPKKVEGDVWTYYILRDGTIALMGLNPNAIPEDGVLYIPNTIDGRRISSFAVSKGSSPMGSYADMWTVPYMQKTIVAAGVPIGYFFWAHCGRIVEFESKTAEEITYYPARRKNLIVPDGSRELYVAAMEKQNPRTIVPHYCILEKSEVVDWYVDDDGLLKGYFGLDGDKYVFPNGIKKIDAASFGGGGDSPKTVILNEDLEEIGKNGLRFGVDEITIPKSVQYVDEFSVTAKNKIFLYRDTVCHEQAFWPDYAEIIYLD